MRFCTVEVDGTTYEIDRREARHIVRAFELLSVVKANGDGPWDGFAYERWERATLLQLLSLETGVHDSLLVGAVMIAQAMIDRKAVWSAWQDREDNRTIPM